MPLKIYIASKISHGDMLLHWSESVPMAKYEYTSRWYKEPFRGMPETPGFSKMFWAIDVKDVKAADLLILYAQEEDHIRGAILEAGIAIGLGKPVILVGENKGFGTWQHHALVVKLAALNEVEQFLEGHNLLWRA